MSQPAQQIAQRYRLRLSEPWKAWFEEDWSQVPLVGSFRAALAPERLVASAPREIWPGFMLPDTLPLLSNEYGDWICVRVEADGSLGELLHWYHGGGDWIPLGNHMAEVIVHDVIDQFRPVTRQMLRGAPESIEARPQTQVLTDFCDPRLQSWLTRRLPSDDQCSITSDQCGLPGPSKEKAVPASTAERVNIITEFLSDSDYQGALQSLRRWRWSEDAAACDLIQFALQHPLDRLADSSIAQRLNMSWSPDYVRWLFDVDHIPHDFRRKVLAIASQPTADGIRQEDRAEAAHRDDDWPTQNWPLAGQIAAEVLQRRNNLGWAVNIAGWSQQRQGELQAAANIYYAGRLASSYSDQGVRMRSHWSEPRYGKFTVAQLLALREHLTPQQRSDDYLLAIAEAPTKSTTAAVMQFWTTKAQQQLNANSPADAYQSFYRAGWDLGVQRLTEYRRILQGLSQTAQAAGWEARAAVAETHLACLNQRLG